MQLRCGTVRLTIKAFGEELGGVMNNKNTTYRITDFAESDRPRERLARLGPGSVSTDGDGVNDIFNKKDSLFPDGVDLLDDPGGSRQHTGGSPG
jgi:hypothetical protein